MDQSIVPDRLLSQHYDGISDRIKTIFDESGFADRLVPYSETNINDRKSTAGVLKHIATKQAEFLGMKPEQVEGDPQLGVQKLVTGMLTELSGDVYKRAYEAAVEQGASNPEEFAMHASSDAVGSYILPLVNAQTDKEKIAAADELVSKLSQVDDDGKHYINTMDLDKGFAEYDKNGKAIELASLMPNTAYVPAISRDIDYSYGPVSYFAPLGESTMTGGLVATGLEMMGNKSTVEYIGARGEYERQHYNASYAVRDMAGAILETSVISAATGPAAPYTALGLTVGRGAMQEYIQEEGALRKQYWGGNERQSAHTQELINNMIFDAATMKVSMYGGKLASAWLSSFKSLRPETVGKLFLGNVVNAGADLGVDVVTDLTTYSAARGLTDDDIFTDNTKNMYESLLPILEGEDQATAKETYDAWTGFLAKKVGARIGSASINKFLQRQHTENTDFAWHDKEKVINKAMRFANNYAFPATQWSEIDMRLRSQNIGTLKDMLQEKDGTQVMNNKTFMQYYLEAEFSKSNMWRMLSNFAPSLKMKLDTSDPRTRMENNIASYMALQDVTAISNSDVNKVANNTVELIQDAINSKGVIKDGVIDTGKFTDIVSTQEWFLRKNLIISEDKQIAINQIIKNRILDPGYLKLDESISDANKNTIQTQLANLFINTYGKTTADNFAKPKVDPLDEDKFNTKYAAMFKDRYLESKAQSGDKEAIKKALDTNELIYKELKKYVSLGPDGKYIVNGINTDEMKILAAARSDVYKDISNVAEVLIKEYEGTDAPGFIDYRKLKTAMTSAAKLNIETSWSAIKSAVDNQTDRGISDDVRADILTKNLTNIKIIADMFGEQVRESVDEIGAEIISTKDSNTKYGDAIRSSYKNKDIWGSEVSKQLRAETAQLKKTANNEIDPQVLFKYIQLGMNQASINKALMAKVYDPDNSIKENTISLANAMLSRNFTLYDGDPAGKAKAIEDALKSAELLISRTGLATDISGATVNINSDTNTIAIDNKKLQKIQRDILSIVTGGPLRPDEILNLPYNREDLEEAIAWTLYKSSLFTTDAGKAVRNNLIENLEKNNIITATSKPKANDYDSSNYTIIADLGYKINKDQIKSGNTDNRMETINSISKVFLYFEKVDYSAEMYQEQLREYSKNDKDVAPKTFNDLLDEFANTAKDQGLNLKDNLYTLHRGSQGPEDLLNKVHFILKSVDPVKYDEYKDSINEFVKEIAMAQSVRGDHEVKYNTTTLDIISHAGKYKDIGNIQIANGLIYFEMDKVFLENNELNPAQLLEKYNAVATAAAGTSATQKYMFVQGTTHEEQFNYIMDMYKTRFENDIKSMELIDPENHRDMLKLFQDDKGRMIKYNTYMPGKDFFEKVSTLRQNIKDKLTQQYQGLLTQLTDLKADKNISYTTHIEDTITDPVVKYISSETHLITQQIDDMSIAIKDMEIDQRTAIDNIYAEFLRIPNIDVANGKITALLGDQSDNFLIKKVVLPDGTPTEDSNTIYHAIAQIKKMTLGSSSGELNKKISDIKEGYQNAIRNDNTTQNKAESLADTYVRTENLSDEFIEYLRSVSKYEDMYTDAFIKTIDGSNRAKQIAAINEGGYGATSGRFNVVNDMISLYKDALAAANAMKTKYTSNDKADMLSDMYNEALMGEGLYLSKNGANFNVVKRNGTMIRKGAYGTQIQAILDAVDAIGSNYKVVFAPEIKDVKTGLTISEGDIHIPLSWSNRLGNTLQDKKQAITGGSSAFKAQMIVLDKSNPLLMALTGGDENTFIIPYTTYKIPDVSIDKAILKYTEPKEIKYGGATYTIRESNNVRQKIKTGIVPGPKAMIIRNRNDEIKAYSGFYDTYKIIPPDDQLLLKTLLTNSFMHAIMRYDATSGNSNNQAAGSDPIIKYIRNSNMATLYNDIIQIQATSGTINTTVKLDKYSKAISSAIRGNTKEMVINSRAAAMPAGTQEFFNSELCLLNKDDAGNVKRTVFKDENGETYFSNDYDKSVKSYNTNSNDICKIGDQSLFSMYKYAVRKLEGQNPDNIKSELDVLSRYRKHLAGDKIYTAPGAMHSDILYMMDYCASKNLLVKTKHDGQDLYFAKVAHFPNFIEGATTLNLIVGIAENTDALFVSRATEMKNDLDFDGDGIRIDSSEYAKDAFEEAWKDYVAKENINDTGIFTFADKINVMNSIANRKLLLHRGMALAGFNSSLNKLETFKGNQQMNVGMQNKELFDQHQYTQYLAMKINKEKYASSNEFNIDKLLTTDDVAKGATFRRKIGNIDKDAWAILDMKDKDKIAGFGSIRNFHRSSNNYKEDGKNYFTATGNGENSDGNPIKYEMLLQEDDKSAGFKILHINCNETHQFSDTLQRTADDLMNRINTSTYTTIIDKYSNALEAWGNANGTALTNAATKEVINGLNTKDFRLIDMPGIYKVINGAGTSNQKSFAASKIAMETPWIKRTVAAIMASSTIHFDTFSMYDSNITPRGFISDTSVFTLPDKNKDDVKFVIDEIPSKYTGTVLSKVSNILQGNFDDEQKVLTFHEFKLATKMVDSKTDIPFDAMIELQPIYQKIAPMYENLIGKNPDKELLKSSPVMLTKFAVTYKALVEFKYGHSDTVLKDLNIPIEEYKNYIDIDHDYDPVYVDKKQVFEADGSPKYQHHTGTGLLILDEKTKRPYLDSAIRLHEAVELMGPTFGGSMQYLTYESLMNYKYSLGMDATTDIMNVDKTKMIDRIYDKIYNIYNANNNNPSIPSIDRQTIKEIIYGAGIEPKQGYSKFTKVSRVFGLESELNYGGAKPYATQEKERAKSIQDKVKKYGLGEDQNVVTFNDAKNPGRVLQLEEMYTRISDYITNLNLNKPSTTTAGQRNLSYQKVKAAPEVLNALINTLTDAGRNTIANRAMGLSSSIVTELVKNIDPASTVILKKDIVKKFMDETNNSKYKIDRRTILTQQPEYVPIQGDCR